MAETQRSLIIWSGPRVRPIFNPTALLCMSIAFSLGGITRECFVSRRVAQCMHISWIPGQYRGPEAVAKRITCVVVIVAYESSLGLSGCLENCILNCRDVFRVHQQVDTLFAAQTSELLDYRNRHAEAPGELGQTGVFHEGCETIWLSSRKVDRLHGKSMNVRRHVRERTVPPADLPWVNATISSALSKMLPFA